MARDKILKHEYVKVAPDTKCHSLKLKTTFEMAPKAKVFVYFVENGELRFDVTTITMPNKFENKVKYFICMLLE